jgi:hypothetical protein
MDYCDVWANIPNLFLILIEKPLRSFHSHHWFHIGEHYLFDLKKPKISLIEPVTIFLLAPSGRFIQQLTKVASFFLLLSLPIQFPTNRNYSMNVFLIDPTVIQKGMLKLPPIGSARKLGNPKLISFALNPYYLLYNSSASYNQQYQHMFDQKSSGEAVRSLLSRLNLDRSTAYPNICFDESSFHYSIGKFPGETSNWFRDQNETMLVRTRINQYCNQIPLEEVIKNIESWSLSHTSMISLISNEIMPLFKLVVYQRDTNRKFVELESILTRIFNKMNLNQVVQWKVMIIHHTEDQHPCALHHILKDADVFLTTHGFQSMGE